MWELQPLKEGAMKMTKDVQTPLSNIEEQPRPAVSQSCQLWEAAALVIQASEGSNFGQ